MINLIPLGIVLILIGFAVILFSAFSGNSSKTDTKVGFVGLIGPFPIGFGTDKQTLYWTIGLTIFVLIIWIWFLRFR